MKWFKHDSDANMDAKLQEVLLDYGLEGYGLYWYILELISAKVDQSNLTFELEHDARVIARNTGCSVQKVEEMMRRFVELKLFESAEGVISCLKLAKRLDSSMTSNANMRELIKNIKTQSHDGVMTESRKVMQEEIRREENRIENKNTFCSEQSSKPDQPKLKKYKFTEDHEKLAFRMANPVRERFPGQQINSDEWADAVRKLQELDKRSRDEIIELWHWVVNHPIRNGFTWADNCRTPMKLRERKDGLQYFEIIQNQMRRECAGGGYAKPQRLDPNDTSWADNLTDGWGPDDFGQPDSQSDFPAIDCDFSRVEECGGDAGNGSGDAPTVVTRFAGSRN